MMLKKPLPGMEALSAAVQLLIGARKGAWIYRSDAEREAWSLKGSIFRNGDRAQDVRLSGGERDEAPIFGALSGG